MRVADMMAADGRVFLKSEWGPIADRWPCVSFSKTSVGKFLRDHTKPGRDILMYVGTSSAANTPDPEHRSALLSAVSVEPRQVIDTKRIVPPAVWKESVTQYGVRWPLSMAVTAAADILGFPSARQTCPQAYSSLGDMRALGNVVEVVGEERDAVRGLEANAVALSYSPDVASFLSLGAVASLSRDLNQEITRMALGIIERVKKGGSTSTSTNPFRSAPNFSDLVPQLASALKAQGNRCALCAGSFAGAARNPLLQMSPDRVDSSSGSYGAENAHIVHLACNWAKNKYSTAHFEEWADAVRGVGPADGEGS